MKLPTNFMVPEFVMQHVLAAPDDWPKPSDPTTAAARIAELRKLLQQPDILHCMCVMVVELATADASIDNQIFDGPHSVYNQQQLIGEKRGLRRFFAELEEIHDSLQTIIKQ